MTIQIGSATSGYYEAEAVYLAFTPYCRYDPPGPEDNRFNNIPYQCDGVKAHHDNHAGGHGISGIPLFNDSPNITALAKTYLQPHEIQ